MKYKKARKARTVAKDKVVKPRRGRPRMTDAEKAADPRRIMMGEIKSDLKKVKKSKKRLALLLEKAKAEQGLLIAALLDSLEKIKMELKKKPRKAKKAKTGKRGRPSRKPGGKRGRKPLVKKSAIKKRIEKKRPGRKPLKKAVARKAAKKTVVQNPAKNHVVKPQVANEEAVKLVSRPTKNQIKKIAPTPIPKPETPVVTSAPVTPGVSDNEPKKE